MKKKFFSAALLVLMVAALMIFATGCNSDASNDASDNRIAALEQENAALKQEIEKLTASQNKPVKNVSLLDWSLDAEAWSDGNGATITFTATPDSYVEGQRAALSIRMGDLEAESTNCNWDGTAFVGSVELSAADGYSYHCILMNLDGTQEEVELNSPDNMADEALVNLGSSLSAYANMIVEDWNADATTLNIVSGYAQCQMPRLSFDGKANGISKAELVLKLNDEEISRKALDLPAGEGEGSFEMSVVDQSFTIPAVVEDAQLDLWLEVVLDNGVTVTAIGGSWNSDGSNLQLLVG